MSQFLLTSSISLSVLLGVYYLLLERQKMHRFNRFYLLGAIAFSFALPFITIEVYREAAIVQMPMAEPFVYNPAEAVAPPEETTDYTMYATWGIYAIGILFMGLRFARNLWQLRSSIRQNEKIVHGDSVLVLLDRPVLPYTFLHYIFISRKDYEQAAIENELYTHELVHVTQKHTLDVLFLEILKIPFWFNPLLYCYKTAIQLNHEFLADEGVVSTTDNVPGYQQLLLRKASPAIAYPLASSFNFSLTKKRFIMMTKSTSKRTALLLKLASLPVAAGLVVLLCTETVAQEKPAASVQVSQTGKNDNDDDQKRDRYYAGVRIIIDDQWNGVKIDKPYEELTPEQKRAYLKFTGTTYTKKSPSATEFNNWKDKNKFALWIDDKNVDNSGLTKLKPEDIAYYNGSSVFKNARTKQHPQPYQFHLYTHEYFDTKLDVPQKYGGKIFEMTVYKNGKGKGNSAAAVINAMEVGEAPREENRLTADYIVSEENTVSSENATTSNDQEDKIYENQELEKQPEYPGGMAAFYSEVNKAFKIPEIKEDIAAKIMVSFVVEKDGSMSNIKVLKDPGHGLGGEAERVLKGITTKWKPGIAKRKAVRTSYVIPISINVKN